MYLIPKRGLLIRDPVTKRILAPEGQEINSNPMFWQRRINDGDVTVGKPPKEAPTNKEGAN